MKYQEDGFIFIVNIPKLISVHSYRHGDDEAEFTVEMMWLNALPSTEKQQILISNFQCIRSTRRIAHTSVHLKKVYSESFLQQN